MIYFVHYSPDIANLINAQVEYLEQQGASTPIVTNWLLELYDRIASLREHPKRFVVDTQRSEVIGYEIRRFNHGEYGVFYRVDDAQAVVEILDFRHGRRLPLSEDESS
ncbi:MAG: type II toxin-antitoxin system RelE/ParE family toxin [Phycisphaerales bacterium]|nr:type II toxin-antitoxin system RelE/ParE family toxin [Phycisphaerales bacterium]